MELNSLNDVLEEQLGDLYDAEKQLVAALPKVVSAAHSDELRKALQDHLEQTQGHIERLEQVFFDLNLLTPTETCEAMRGLLREGEKIVNATGDPAAKDAALIAAAQRVEHYEISAYGTARTLARELGHGDAASMLEQTLDEESHADSILTKIATGGMLRGGVNKEAVSRK